MDKLSTLVATILAISIACERIVEILKGMFPNFWLFEPAAGSREARRTAGIHVLAGFCGAFVAWASGIDLSSLLGVADSNPATMKLHAALGYLVLGLLASGGSAFWNHILDILQAAKVQQEEKAQVAEGADASDAAVQPADSTVPSPAPASA